MDISSSSTPSTSGCEFSSDSIRHLPEQALIVPRLLQLHKGNPSLHVVSNGRGEDYVLLRIFKPSATGGRGAQFYHYAGKLDPAQLRFLDQLVAEHRAQLIPSGPERLRNSQPELNHITSMLKASMRIANYSAALAGFSFRCYDLHTRSSRLQASILPPPIPEFTKSRQASVGNRHEHLEQALVNIRNSAAENPLKALDNSLFVADMLCELKENLLSNALLFSFFERGCTLLEYGAVRPLAIIECRAMTRLNKTRSIRTAINKSRAKIAKAIAKKAEVV